MEVAKSKVGTVNNGSRSLRKVLVSTGDLKRFGYPEIAFIWFFSIAYQIA